MGFFVRKVSPAKWPDGENVFFRTAGELNADAITCDLKTKSNEFSWWWINNLDELERMAISIASVFDTKASIFVVAVPEEKMRALQLNLKNTPEYGITAITALKENHFDICKLNVKRLLDIAELVAISIQQKSVLMVSRKNIMSKLKNLMEEGQVDTTCLGKAYSSL